MTALVLRGDARHLPLPDASVDLVVTSPPYWGLRSYTDGGEHYDAQIGSEPTPDEYIDNLAACTAEWVRVLKPTGSLFVNLGDAYANTATPERIGSSDGATCRADRPGRRTSAGTGVRPKSLYGLPWRYALACIDDLGLILRAEVIWAKVNGLPESVKDRVRRSHEQWFHLVRQPRYFAAIDEIRQPHAQTTVLRAQPHRAPVTGTRAAYQNMPAQTIQRDQSMNPLGALPGSVWEIATEPLTVPDHLGVDHFAAFPTEWPRRIILGWSPSGICTACGEGRRPVVSGGGYDPEMLARRGTASQAYSHSTATGRPSPLLSVNLSGPEKDRYRIPYAITCEVCACPDTTAPTRPSVVVDPFGGTGTTALVAKALGRTGITIDRSADYCRLATWRTTDPGQLAKALRVPKPPTQADGQLDLFDDAGGAA